MPRTETADSGELKITRPVDSFASARRAISRIITITRWERTRSTAKRPALKRENSTDLIHEEPPTSPKICLVVRTTRPEPSSLSLHRQRRYLSYPLYLGRPILPVNAFQIFAETAMITRRETIL